MNKIIILNNKECQIVSEDENLIKRLRRLLSFKMEGVEYTPAYKNGWDGVTYLLSKSNKFNLGLLDKVKNYLNDNEYKFEINDKRKSKIINQPLDISENLNKIGITPRDYQIDILNACIKNDRGIVRAATGCGKSLITGLVTAQLNKSTIIYVIGLDLLKQFHDLYSSLFKEEIGFIGNGICNIKRINIASIWTIGRALSLDKKSIISDEESDDKKDLEKNQKEKVIDMLKSSKIHIFDESHVVTTNTIDAIYKVIDPERIYGFSGTPFKDNGTNLLVHNILGNKIVDVGASLLIEKKVLAQPIIKFISVPKMSDVGSTYLEVYKKFIVENDIRNNIIIASVKELLEKKYVPLMLFKQIKHGKILSELLDQNNITHALLDGTDSLEKRTEVKKLLMSGKLHVALCSTIADIGLDIPILSGLVLCGSGKSTVRAAQRIGRCVRMYPGKKHVAVVDFYDQAKYLKNHSLKRAEVYEAEPGFKVIKCTGMK